MTELTLEMLHTELAPLKAGLMTLQASVAALQQVQQDMHALRAAFNGFARQNVTPRGEISALHNAISHVREDHCDLERRVATLERLIGELQK